MLAVWAPKTMRLARVLWRSCSGWKRWGKAVGMGAFSPSPGPPAMGLLKSTRPCADRHRHRCRERLEILGPVCRPIMEKNHVLHSWFIAASAPYGTRVAPERSPFAARKSGDARLRRRHA